MKKGTIRKLSTVEIEQLQNQGCSAHNWNLIEVSDDFSPQYIRNTQFSGVVRLGCYNQLFMLDGGIPRQAGIYNATIHNCTIGDNVLIENISEHIANYDIANDCRIQNVSRISVTHATSFGNGIEVAVLNEVGGREVAMYDHMSAHFAYIMALYRHNQPLIDQLSQLVTNYAEKITSSRGTIGYGTKITSSGTIENVKMGEFTTIDSATRLKDGSINSNKEAPIFIGSNVVADKFIISSGAVVSDGASLYKTFVGQACHISKQFSSHDSLFFSNCQCENGEACAVFAGPYTVTMHKSSLLIAGMFSFLNAGSGSNQSNHLYKLGPIHQGIVERGSKTTSDSYILWPAKVGAFSLIMGRHVSHADTSSLPFSYLIEQDNTTYLVPGVNLRSVGTIRDAKKWPVRDKRTDKLLLDKINFNLLSPFTIRKMLKGVDILHSLKDLCGEHTSLYSYNNVTIKRSSLTKGIDFYNLAIDKFLGNSLISRLQGRDISNDHELRIALTPDSQDGVGEWIDLSGLIVPKRCINRLIKNIELGKIESIDRMERTFSHLHRNYYDLEWSWAWHELLLRYNLSDDLITLNDIIAIIERWRKAVTRLDELLYNDARKEFSLSNKVGFGMDGKYERREKDFESVRGDFDNNPFVKSVVEHIKEKNQLGDNIIAQLRLNYEKSI